MAFARKSSKSIHLKPDYNAIPHQEAYNHLLHVFRSKEYFSKSTLNDLSKDLNLHPRTIELIAADVQTEHETGVSKNPLRAQKARRITDAFTGMRIDILFSKLKNLDSSRLAGLNDPLINLLCHSFFRYYAKEEFKKKTESQKKILIETMISNFLSSERITQDSLDKTNFLKSFKNNLQKLNLNEKEKVHKSMIDFLTK